MKKRERRYTIRKKGDSLLRTESEWFYTTDSLDVAKNKFIKARFIDDQYITVYDNKEKHFIMWLNLAVNDQPWGVLYFNNETKEWTKEKLV